MDIWLWIIHQPCQLCKNRNIYRVHHYFKHWPSIERSLIGDCFQIVAFWTKEHHANWADGKSSDLEWNSAAKEHDILYEYVAMLRQILVKLNQKQSTMSSRHIFIFRDNVSRKTWMVSFIFWLLYGLCDFSITLNKADNLRVHKSTPEEWIIHHFIPFMCQSHVASVYIQYVA
jgi:hypothetical protein